jgi:hypothetical protein
MLEGDNTLMLMIVSHVSSTSHILAFVFISVIATNQAQAETGKGTDVFRVIMTIFGADKSKVELLHGECK